MEPTRPAGEVWTVTRKPVDILGRLKIRLDFQLLNWDISVHHTMCDTIHEAEEECRKLREDLAHLMDSEFRAKYRIAHDLRAGF